MTDFDNETTEFDVQDPLCVALESLGYALYNLPNGLALPPIKTSTFYPTSLEMLAIARTLDAALRPFDDQETRETITQSVLTLREMELADGLSLLKATLQAGFSLPEGHEQFLAQVEAAIPYELAPGYIDRLQQDIFGKPSLRDTGAQDHGRA